MFIYCEQIFYIIISLQKHGQNTVRFLAWFGRQPLGYFFLNHTRANRNTVFVIQHLKEDLTADVIRIITDHVELPFGNQLIQIQLQEIALHQIQLRVPLTQISNRLAVNLNGRELNSFVLK